MVLQPIEDDMGRFQTRFVEELFAVVVLFQVGCSSSPATFTLTDSGKVVSAMLGDELDIKLSNIGPSTYGDPILSSNSVQYLSVSVVGPYSPGGPTQLFKFKAVAKGPCTVTIPKVNDPTGTLPAFTLTVNVD